MVRVRQPGGKITAEQYLGLDRLSHDASATAPCGSRPARSSSSTASSRTTSPATIRAINESLLSTLAACGDVERNVPAAPRRSATASATGCRHDADAFASHFAPRASSYWDIWLDGEKIANPCSPRPAPILVPTPGDDATEPIYGKDVPPPQVQDRLRPARRQLHRRLRQRPRLPRRRRGWRSSSATTSSSAADWARPPAPARPSRRWAGPLTFVEPRDVLKVGEASSRSTATPATAPTASGPG